MTFCNFECSHCVNHVQFFLTNAEKFPELGIAFTKCFVSESHSGAVVAGAGGIDLRFDVRSSPLLHQLDATALAIVFKKMNGFWCARSTHV